MKTLNNIIIDKLNTLKEDYFNGVKERFEKIQEISNTFESTNLKIHDVSYRLYKAVDAGLLTDEQASDLFQHICECEYDSFTEWESENLSYVKRDYCGRTSSFFYNSNWYGMVVDECNVQELLEGKKLSMYDLVGNLEANVYDYIMQERAPEELVSNIASWFEERYSLEEMNKEELEGIVTNFLEDEKCILNDVDNDLDTLEKIVQEAKEAYDYLAHYKRQENEYEIADGFLQSEIEESLAEEKAKEIFTEILEAIAPLNKIKFINVSYINVNIEYSLVININIHSELINLGSTKFLFNLGFTKFDEHSEHMVKLIVEEIQEKVNKYFNVNMSTKIDEIKKRVNGSTNARWKMNEYGEFYREDNQAHITYINDYEIVATMRDFDLMLHAREDIMFLLDHIQDLEKHIEFLEDSIKYEY